MTPAQKLAAAKGITLRAAYLQLHAAGQSPAGPARGKPTPCPLALINALAAVREARAQWSSALWVASPSPDLDAVRASTLARQIGVDRATVSRWINGEDRPPVHHQPAVADWCRRVLEKARRLKSRRMSSV